VDSTAQKIDKNLAGTCQHFWKSVSADNLHMVNCITVPLGTQYVDCQFVWHLIQGDCNLQSLSSVLREHRCSVHYTCFGYFLPSLFRRHNLTETHQYHASFQDIYISGTRVAATSQCEKLKCVGYLQWYRGHTEFC
jgi:hypothetical protein